MEDNKACLFCNTLSDSFENNLEHMQEKHGFFILEKDMCVDPTKLFKHLAKKIFVKKMCIFYDYKFCGTFKTGQNVQLHMCDKGHCCMNQDAFQEYDNFYDFTEENERVVRIMEEKAKNLKGGEEFDYHMPESNNQCEGLIKEEVSEEEWEDIDDDGIKKTVDNEEISENKAEKVEAPTKNYQRKVFRLRRAKIMDNDELMLPSGKIAGHKKYGLYYKQRAVIPESTQLRRLENGRGVYSGKKTYDEALMIKNNMKNGEGQVLSNDYNKF